MRAVPRSGGWLRSLDWCRRLATAESARRKAETDASYAQDEAKRLRQIQSAPAPKKKTASFGWFESEED